MRVGLTLCPGHLHAACFFYKGIKEETLFHRALTFLELFLLPNRLLNTDAVDQCPSLPGKTAFGDLSSTPCDGRGRAVVRIRVRVHISAGRARRLDADGKW